MASTVSAGLKPHYEHQGWGQGFSKVLMPRPQPKSTESSSLRGGTQALVFMFLFCCSFSVIPLCGRWDSDIKLQAKTNTSWKMIRPEFSFDPHLIIWQIVNISKLREFTYLRAHLTQSSLLKYSPGFCRQIWVWDSWTTVIKLFLALLKLLHINVIDLYANWRDSEHAYLWFIVWKLLFKRISYFSPLLLTGERSTVALKIGFNSTKIKIKVEK